MNNGHIYKITNLINGKTYIGQTVSKLKSRKSDHKNRCDCPKLKGAIKKYGWKNFTFEPIICALDTSFLDDLEIESIKKHDSISNGYNISVGGNGKGRVSEETKKKISIGNKGKKRSKKVRLNLSEKAKERFKDKNNHPMFNKPMPKKAREALLKRNEKIKRPVIQLSLDGKIIKKYNSLGEASGENNFDISAIIRCCKGKQKTSYGYIWKYSV